MGLIKLLIELGADINFKDKHGRNSLVWAVQEGNARIAEYLINNGSDVDTSDNEGLTPLHYTSLNGDLAIADLLIKEGADVNIRDNTGRSALHYSILEKNEHVTDIILQAGAKVYPIEETTEDIYATAISYQKLARNYAKYDNDIEAKGNYISAARYFEKASLGFRQKQDEISKEIRTKEFSVATENFLLFMAAVAAQTAVDYGAQMQAKQQARLRAEMSALQMANKTGTGHAGYFRAMESFKVDNTVVISPQVPMPQMRRADISAAKKLKDSYVKLYEKSLQEMFNIKKLLECYEKNTGKAGLDRCR